EGGESRARMRVPVVITAGAAVAALAFATPTVASSRAACARPQVSPAYAGSVRRALLAKQDVWGKALIARAISALPQTSCFARSARRTLPAYAGLTCGRAQAARLEATVGVANARAATAAPAVITTGTRIRARLSPPS